VEAHWTCNAEKFRPPETTDAVSAFNTSFVDVVTCFVDDMKTV